MAAEMTTIQISVDLKARLEALKDHPRQSYNEVILRLVEEQTGVVENRKVNNE
jgi:predicted CopG family antitoxin